MNELSPNFFWNEYSTSEIQSMLFKLHETYIKKCAKLCWAFLKPKPQHYKIIVLEKIILSKMRTSKTPNSKLKTLITQEIYSKATTSKI